MMLQVEETEKAITASVAIMQLRLTGLGVGGEDWVLFNMRKQASTKGQGRATLIGAWSGQPEPKSY